VRNFAQQQPEVVLAGDTPANPLSDVKQITFRHAKSGIMVGDALPCDRFQLSGSLTMSGHYNHLGQPIGFPLPDWSPRQQPPRTAMVGRYCRVEPLDLERHADELFAANAEDRDGSGWTYLPYGPFDTFEAYRRWAAQVAALDDPLFHAIVDLTTDRAVGVAAFLRIEKAMGAIEVGSIKYSPLLQRRPAATEAMYLMMRRVFDELGYRRYEWKCNALNAPSRAAAERYGFTFEGVFRQAMVAKGNNRDTAWYAILDSEWPERRAAFEAWLAPDNFDAEGRQRASLSALRKSAAR
jgi:RimJ/RimL family protein N-acetyltransferase